MDNNSLFKRETTTKKIKELIGKIKNNIRDY